MFCSFLFALTFFYLSALNKNLEKVLPFCFANTLSWREPVLNEHSQSTIVEPLGQQKLKNHSSQGQAKMISDHYLYALHSFGQLHKLDGL